MRRVKKTYQKDEKLFSMNLNEIKNHDGKSFSSGKNCEKAPGDMEETLAFCD